VQPTPRAGSHSVRRPRAGKLVIPHTDLNEDEFSFVFRGRIGGRVGDQDVVVGEGGIPSSPRTSCTLCGTQPTPTPSSSSSSAPQAPKAFFEEMGALQSGVGPDIVSEIDTRYGQTPHPELIAELSELYNVAP